MCVMPLMCTSRERVLQPFDGSCPVGAMRDHLHDHRIVERRHLVAFAIARLDTDALHAGTRNSVKGPGLGMNFFAGFSA